MSNTIKTGLIAALLFTAGCSGIESKAVEPTLESEPVSSVSYNSGGWLEGFANIRETQEIYKKIAQRYKDKEKK